jgi:hypothetical protein
MPTAATTDLKDAGTLPTVDEEGAVPKEVDVYSEPPEIDTTRADPPPPVWRRRLVIGTAVVVGCNLVVFVVFLIGLLVGRQLNKEKCVPKLENYSSYVELYDRLAACAW